MADYRSAKSGELTCSAVFQKTPLVHRIHNDRVYRIPHFDDGPADDDILRVDRANNIGNPQPDVFRRFTKRLDRACVPFQRKSDEIFDCYFFVMIILRPATVK